jgi:hypothetical protein
MTRQECEAKLISLADQMRKVYLEYNPAGDYLSAGIDSSGHIRVEDAFFTKETKIIRDVHGNAFKTVAVTKYVDGHISYGRPVREEASA